MKIKSLLFGLLACTALVACSNEDLVGDEGNNEKPLEGDAYVAVNFVMPGGTGRALGNFDDGTADENKVTSATFLFFNGSGQGCANPKTIDGKELETWSDGTGSIDKISKAVIVLENPTGIPASIVALLNLPKSVTDTFSASTTLNQIMANYGEYATATAGNFVMSNSVYLNANGEKVIGAPVSAANIGKTVAEATANPVSIPVERVVAKVSVTGLETSGDGGKLGSDNIKVVLKGWKLTGTNSDSYLVKSIDDTWQGTWWNDLANQRSYWATSYNGTYERFSHDEIAANQSAEYCLENTTGTTATQMIAAAELQVKGLATTIVRWHGNLYTEAGFKTEFANLAEVKQYYIKTSATEYKSLTANELDFAFNTSSSKDVTANDYDAIVTVKSGTAQIYTISGSGIDKVATPVEPAIVNATLKGLATVKLWKDGKTYFFTDIEHNGGDAGAMGRYGIVRNHVYKLTINSISGLGTPVPDPGKDIIPVKPGDDEESYIAAEVQVLRWKVVNQSVDLN